MTRSHRIINGPSKLELVIAWAEDRRRHRTVAFTRGSDKPNDVIEVLITSLEYRRGSQDDINFKGEVWSEAGDSFYRVHGVYSMKTREGTVFYGESK